MPESTVEVRDLIMQFPAVRALDGVSLALRPGEVHGVIGENGAGKSTLMRILAGLQRPTAGEVLVGGQPVHLKHHADAARLGIAMIHQELNLVDELSVAANIFLGREQTTAGHLNSRAMNRAATRILTSLDCPIDPTIKVRKLSIAQQQMVEIAKAVSQDARVLIMDEPTAVLTAREVQALFSLIARLKGQGVTIAYISHILPEVLKVCDRITVLRDGKWITTLDESRVKTTTEHELAGLMVGRQMEDFFPPRHPVGIDIVLSVKNLSVPGLVHEVSFDLHAGEILGFAGLIGAGRTEMAEALVGLRNRSAGTIHVRRDRNPTATSNGGISIPPYSIRSSRDAIRAGIAYLSEDRKGTGLTLEMDVAENTTLVSLKRYGSFWINRRAEERATRQHVAALNTRVGRLRDPVRTLSGGNQQKVLLAKWLETDPKVLIIDEPTRGVDIGAKRQIYELIASLTARGMACILISSELNEVLGLAHRIAVMRAGRIQAILDASSATEQSVMYHAAGVNLQKENQPQMNTDAHR
jgi:ribose transport system ATP-binding protein